jgi:hypothetical protein
MRLVAAFAALAFGCAPALAQGGQVHKPTGMHLLPDTERGHAAIPLPSRRFVETQLRQLMLVTFDKAAAGQTYRFAIRAVDTTASASAVLLTGEAAVTSEGVVPLQARLPGKWPVGTYDVLVSRNGLDVERLAYEVVPEKPRVGPITVESIAIERVVRPGQVEGATPIRASYRHLNFAAVAKGANTDGVKLTWVLRAEQTTGGAGEVSKLEIPKRLIENTEIMFDVELPRDWPTGRYRVDLSIDDKPAASRTFQIEP